MSDIINVAIVGAGRGGSGILKVLLALDSINIIGVADIRADAPGVLIARENGIFTTDDYRELICRDNIDVVIEATGVAQVVADIKASIPDKIVFVQSKAALLFMSIVKKQEELLMEKEHTGHLETILNSAQEGIQACDNTGKILYLNKAFFEITKKTPQDYVDKNVFEVSPHGSLAKVLKTKEPVFGWVNVIKDSNVEVVSNASPIMVNGEMKGAVVVFRDLSDIKKMAETIAKSKETIEVLKNEFNQLASAKYSFSDLVGENAVFVQCKKHALRAARSDSGILITGESGTGKELFAHAIHNSSPRADGPFIKMNCAAIPENLLESEMYGYEKGAFTGAGRTKIGKFELADGGTIFLDEIGDMSLPLQSKLLRVLQEREIERLGSNRIKTVDIRIIAATNQNLEQMVEKKTFREDLYYRLKVINIQIPPLRERKDDLPALIEFFINIYNKKSKKDCRISPEVTAMMLRYNWPGNVRELQNILERAIVLSEGEYINPQLVTPYLDVKPNRAANDDSINEIIPLEEMEKQALQKALALYGDSLAGKKRAAQELNISLATLYNRIKKYKNEPKQT